MVPSIITVKQLYSINHASGPESVAGNVDDPSDLVDEADVDDVEDDTEQSHDQSDDADRRRLDATERRNDVARVAEVQQRLGAAGVFKGLLREVDDCGSRLSPELVTARTLAVAEGVHRACVTSRTVGQLRLIIQPETNRQCKPPPRQHDPVKVSKGKGACT